MELLMEFDGAGKDIKRNKVLFQNYPLQNYLGRKRGWMATYYQLLRKQIKNILHLIHCKNVTDIPVPSRDVV
jgi:hypothetical protein